MNEETKNKKLSNQSSKLLFFVFSINHYASLLIFYLSLHLW
jgi:hypothetical protein